MSMNSVLNPHMRIRVIIWMVVYRFIMEKAGRGKTTAALGLGIRAAGVGKQVIMVQFLKKKHSDTLDFLKNWNLNYRFSALKRPLAAMATSPMRKAGTNR